ncbi:MAG: TatD family hydrolase, partial [Candidatus Omnitrophica bacterium]|nr:TatD family hydrolase [Candidatus Omnitrophota bacterium]
QKFLDSAISAGFGCLFNCAITPADWPLIKSLSEKDSRIVPFFGFHPWFADLADDKSLKLLAEYLAWPSARAGEMGLDRARKNVDFEMQKDVFARQLDLAGQFRRPFVVHCVRAWAETIGLIKKHAPGSKFLMHSFNGSKEVAREIADMGGYFSLSVRQLLKPDDVIRETFMDLPEDRVLVETDFPYQVKWTGAGDYIAAVKQGYQVAAEWKGMPIAEFRRRVYSNGAVFADRAITGQG